MTMSAGTSNVVNVVGSKRSRLLRPSRSRMWAARVPGSPDGLAGSSTPPVP
ncbi:hypothetical protein Ae706Ps2_6726 [Pseudonocardia sp. Ae706_Ps2]|nr:hypothetical protein Ae706Ps2_6726 [Pseudonocardia sp. Ae706_Ps2]